MSNADQFWKLCDDLLATMNDAQFARVSDRCLAASKEIPLRHRLWLAIQAEVAP